MPTGVERPWKGWTPRKPSQEWQDPTFDTVELLLKRRIRHSRVIVRLDADELQFWDGEDWSTSLNKAKRFRTEFSAWQVAECFQTGFIDVQILPE